MLKIRNLYYFRPCGWNQVETKWSVEKSSYTGKRVISIGFLKQRKKGFLEKSPGYEEVKNLLSLNLHQFEVQHLLCPWKTDSGDTWVWRIEDAEKLEIMNNKLKNWFENSFLLFSGKKKSYEKVFLKKNRRKNVKCHFFLFLMYQMKDSYYLFCSLSLPFLFLTKQILAFLNTWKLLWSTNYCLSW